MGSYVSDLRSYGESHDLKRFVPLIMLIATAVIFGALFSVNRFAIAGGVPPIAYAFWQSLGAGLALLFLALFTKSLPRLDLIYLRTYIVSGVLGIAFPISLLSIVAAKLPASALTLVLALSPPLTYLFALLLGMERFRIVCIIGILVGLAGVVLMVVPEASLPEPEMAGWLLLSLLAPVSFAMVNAFAGKFRPPEAPSVMLACGLLLASAVFLLPVMFATGQAYIPLGENGIGDWAVLMAVAINAAFWLLFFEIVRRAGSVFFSQFNYLAVLAGIAWAMLIFAERPSVYIWGALALLFLGLALVNRGIKKRRA
ncbi:MAG: DMT family transporter [Rhodospirillaceae bacterium]|nr:DMT family transporter [Rhodospirillaceae bacterium]